MMIMLFTQEQSPCEDVFAPEGVTKEDLFHAICFMAMLDKVLASNIQHIIFHAFFH